MYSFHPLLISIPRDPLGIEILGRKIQIHYDLPINFKQVFHCLSSFSILAPKGLSAKEIGCAADRALAALRVVQPVSLAQSAAL